MGAFIVRISFFEGILVLLVPIWRPGCMRKTGSENFVTVMITFVDPLNSLGQTSAKASKALKVIYIKTNFSANDSSS